MHLPPNDLVFSFDSFFGELDHGLCDYFVLSLGDIFKLQSGLLGLDNLIWTMELDDKYAEKMKSKLFDYQIFKFYLFFILCYSFAGWLSSSHEFLSTVWTQARIWFRI